MTREELAALLSDIAGLRLRPVEMDTILAAADMYAATEARRVVRCWTELAAVPLTGPDVA